MNEKCSHFCGFLLVVFVICFGFNLPSAQAEPTGQTINYQNNSLGASLSSEQRIWGSWSLGLSGQTYSDQTDSQSFASMGLGIRAGTILLRDLTFDASLSVIARSGFSQRRFGRDSLNDGINVHEALISYNPMQSFFTLDAGIINQRHLGSGLLTSNLPFPGLRQTASFHYRSFNYGVRAQQAIPTSRSLDTQTRSEKESTPSFYTESLFLNYLPTSRFSLGLSATQFRFKNLPTNVAYQSRLLGNSVPHSTPATASFAFDFEGQLYTVSTRYALSRSIELDGRAEFLKNQKAPDAFNQGYLLEAGVGFNLYDHHIRFGAGTFFNESDSSPSAYNSSRFGHNNRDGRFVSLETLISQRVRFTTTFTDSDVINPDFVTTRQQHLTLAIGTVYADF